VSSRIGELIRATSRRAEHDPCRLSAKTRQRWEHEYDLERRGAA